MGFRRASSYFCTHLGNRQGRSAHCCATGALDSGLVCYACWMSVLQSDTMASLRFTSHPAWAEYQCCGPSQKY